ncbi:MAG: hypothetical protein IJ635_07100 [Bacteroidaceae bacterium]|nr:hypothetical protein [Bacteroidaceae bacterium]
MTAKKYDIERLRAIPMHRVVERWGGRLHRSGVRQVTNCPWHNDEHPSLTLYEAGGENRCHCFACGRGGSVIDYVMAREGVDFKGACELLGRAFGVGEREACRPSGVSSFSRFSGLTSSTSFSSSTSSSRPSAEPEPSYIPLSWLQPLVSVENSFCRCLLQMFDRHLVEHLTEEYRLGCYDNGRYDDCVLFPSIDREGRLHNVKVQHYCTDPASPRFAHGDKGCCYWLGTTLVREGVVTPPLGEDGQPLPVVLDNDCLFGEHLLRRYPRTTVALVESPKNALVGAAVQPEYLWIATGSKSMLKRPLMERLRGRQVVVFPDRDAIAEWTERLHGMRDIATFTVSDFCERHAAEGDTKYDIADFVVEQFLSTIVPPKPEGLTDHRQAVES